MREVKMKRKRTKRAAWQRTKVRNTTSLAMDWPLMRNWTRMDALDTCPHQKPSTSQILCADSCSVWFSGLWVKDMRNITVVNTFHPIWTLYSFRCWNVSSLNKPCCSHSGHRERRDVFASVHPHSVVSGSALPTAGQTPENQTSKQSTNPTVFIIKSPLMPVFCEVQRWCSHFTSPFYPSRSTGFYSNILLTHTTYVQSQRDEWDSVTPTLTLLSPLWMHPVTSKFQSATLHKKTLKYNHVTAGILYVSLLVAVWLKTNLFQIHTLYAQGHLCNTGAWFVISEKLNKM